MKYDDINPVLREWIAGAQALRKLGFAADEIFCLVSKSAMRVGQYACFLKLDTQGKEFTVDLGTIGCTPKQFMKAHRKACEAIANHTMSDETLKRVYEGSGIYQQKVSLLSALDAKGFRFPCEPQAPNTGIERLN